jgi:putative transposase
MKFVYIKIFCMKSGRRRKFTDEEKINIVNDTIRRGTNVVLREHNLSYSVFARWKDKFETHESIEEKSRNKLLNQLKILTVENERLKRIVANQALMLQVKVEKLNSG